MGHKYLIVWKSGRFGGMFAASIVDGIDDVNRFKHNLDERKDEVIDLQLQEDGNEVSMTVGEYLSDCQMIRLESEDSVSVAERLVSCCDAAPMSVYEDVMYDEIDPEDEDAEFSYEGEEEGI